MLIKPRTPTHSLSYYYHSLRQQGNTSLTILNTHTHTRTCKSKILNLKYTKRPICILN